MRKTRYVFSRDDFLSIQVIVMLIFCITVKASDMSRTVKLCFLACDLNALLQFGPKITRSDPCFLEYTVYKVFWALLPPSHFVKASASF